VTREIISSFCSPDPEKIEMLRDLSARFRIAVCSNAIRETVQLMLERSELAGYVSLILSNEDVTEPKPSPEIYRKALDLLDIDPLEAVIVEDSDVGKRAATLAGAYLCSVSGPHEVNYYRVMKTVSEAERPNLVIPSAGQGRRFSEVGYQYPKPLIQVDGQPMIQVVMENLTGVGRPIVIMQRKHIDHYCAEYHLKRVNPETVLVTTDGLTEGSTCTILLARELINNQNELIMANSDQYVDFDVKEFVAAMRARRADAGMITFKASHPKWSYAKIGPMGEVEHVAEKQVISDQATVGIYYYRRGSDFVRYAERMIAKNIRVNGEFYVSQAFNEYIADGKRVLTFEIASDAMHGLGTPEDLEAFLALPRTHGRARGLTTDLSKRIEVKVTTDSGGGTETLESEGNGHTYSSRT